ncbi:MAG: hypothetical protein SGARI_000232 [Bacillariaceae sp.]
MTPQQRDLYHRKQKERFLMFTRVLIKYLEQKDKALHQKAKLVIKDCADRNKRGEKGYESVTIAMQRRLKDLVGETYWKKAQDFLLMMSQKRKAQQEAAGGGASVGNASFGSRHSQSAQAKHNLTEQQKRAMYEERKRKQAAIAAQQKDKQVTPLEQLRQEVHNKREQVAMQNPQAGLPQVTAAAGKGTSGAAQGQLPAAAKGKKAVRRRSGTKQVGGGSTVMTAAPIQIVTALTKPVVVEPPREYEELMQLIDHAVDYDWPSIGQLLGDKDDLKISEEERQLLYGDTSPMPAAAMAAAKSADATQPDTAAQGQTADATRSASLSQPGWGRTNVLSARGAWAKIRLREKKQRDASGSKSSAPTVAGGLLSLPTKDDKSGASTASPAADGLWVNEETAEQDKTLSLLSEGCQIYLKGVLEKAIQCSRQRQNLDGIRLWHQQYAAIEEEPKPVARGPDDPEETEEEKAKREKERQEKLKQNKPPLSLRLGCDISRQVAQSQGNAAMTVKRMEEALERQMDIPSHSRELTPSAGLAEATSMNDLAMRPLLKEGATKADYNAKRSFETYGGKESKDPPLGRVPKQAKLVVDDFIMGSKLSQEGPYNKAFTASHFISF